MRERFSPIVKTLQCESENGYIKDLHSKNKNKKMSVNIWKAPPVHDLLTPK